MKQTYVTALLLWLMLAGVCRGQGKHNWGITAYPQIAIGQGYYKVLGGGAGVGINYEPKISNKWTLKLGSHLTYLYNYTSCDSIVVGSIPPSLPRESFTCLDAQRSGLWYVQMPLMSYYYFTPQNAYSLRVGSGLQGNILLLNTDLQANFFDYNSFTLGIPVSIGTSILLPFKRHLNIELVYDNMLSLNRRYRDYISLWSIQTTFKW